MLTNRCLIGVVLFLVATLVAGAAAAADARVGAVRIGHEVDRTRVAIDLSSPVEYKLFTLSNPHRVVVDLKDTRISGSVLSSTGAGGTIRQVRGANRKGGWARIVIDVSGPMKLQSFVLLPRDGYPNRLVVDLRPLALLKPAARLPVKSVDNRKTGRDIVVAIDAGHGGKDPGARGRNGLREKDVVLAMSRNLADLVNAQPGMRAKMTRNSDQFVHLRDRMERARRAEADLFISIHADAFRDRRVRGATIYVLSRKGAADEADLRLAHRENVALIGGVELNDKDDDLSFVLMDLVQNASFSSSIDVGDEIIREIGQVTRVRKRKVQQAPFLVLKSPDVPSILIETAFISNPNDEKNLGSRKYRETLARAIFNGVQDYFRANPPVGTRLAMAMDAARAHPPARHVIRQGDTLSKIADRYNVSVQRIRLINNLHGDKIVVGRALQIPATQDI
jgi:N-acetylmuramoyl-L-alanine amidase